MERKASTRNTHVGADVPGCPAGEGRGHERCRWSNNMTIVCYNDHRESAMQEIAISEFKAKCLAVLERVRSTKKPIRVTRFGKPVAEIVPPTSIEERSSWIGSMKNSMRITGDIVSPATDEDEWEVLRD